MSDKLEQRAECFSKDLKIFVKTNSKVDVNLIVIDFINNILSNGYVLKVVKETQKIGYIAGAKSERASVIGKIRDWARNEPIAYRQYSTIDLLEFLKLIEEEE